MSKNIKKSIQFILPSVWFVEYVIGKEHEVTNSSKDCNKVDPTTWALNDSERDCKTITKISAYFHSLYLP